MMKLRRKIAMFMALVFGMTMCYIPEKTYASEVQVSYQGEDNEEIIERNEMDSDFPQVDLREEAESDLPIVNEAQVTARIMELAQKLGINDGNLNDGWGIQFTENGGACPSGHPTDDAGTCGNCLNTNVIKSEWFRQKFGYTIDIGLLPGHYYPVGNGGNEGQTCHGFVNFALWYIAKDNSTSNVYRKLVGTKGVAFTKENLVNSGVRIGDVIRIGGLGHSVMFLGYGSGNTIKVLDCNYVGGVVSKVATVRIHSIDLNPSYTMAITRAVNYEPDSNTSVEFNSCYVSQVSDTNAILNCSFDSSHYITEYGIYIKKDNAAYIKLSKMLNNATQSLSYDIINDCGTTLQSGTAYNYYWYIISGGVEYKSEEQSFITTGTTIVSSFPLVDGNNYRIRNVASNKLLTSVDSPDVYIIQYDDLNNDKQLWKAIKTSEGYSFVSKYNNLAFDLQFCNIITGNKLMQYEYAGGLNQVFKIVERGDGNYSIHPNSSNLALDMFGSSSENGTEVIQYGYQGGYNQLWKFELVAPLNSISLNKTSLTLNVGNTETLSVNYNPSNTTDSKTITWTSSNTNVATVSGGKVTAKAPGTVTITATCGSKKATCIVTVKQPLSSISLNKTSLTLNVSGTETLSVNYNPSNTTDSKTITWTSSNTSVATVSGGKVTAKAPGTATITATCENKKAICTVTVNRVLTPVEAFVERMYTVALNRPSDEGGKSNWVTMLNSGTHDGAGLASEFILGEEFVMRGLTNEQYVDVLYQTFFDRKADEEGKNLWVKILKSGQTRAYVLSEFVNLPEFTILCASYGIERGVMLENGTAVNPGIPQFVKNIYTIVLSRDAENEGLYNNVLALVVGALNAEQLAKNFFTSQEYLMKNKDAASYVADLYAVFMNREADAAGFDFWVSCIEQYGMTRESVLSEFATSAEFKAVAASYGLN